MSVNVTINYSDIDPYLCHRCKACLGEGLHHGALSVCKACARDMGVADTNLSKLVIPGPIKAAYRALQEADCISVGAGGAALGENCLVSDGDRWYVIPVQRLTEWEDWLGIAGEVPKWALRLSGGPTGIVFTSWRGEVL